jgi:hypothetical protein
MPVDVFATAPVPARGALAAAAVLVLFAGAGCSDPKSGDPSPTAEGDSANTAGRSAERSGATAESGPTRAEKLDENYPLHGLVTGIQIPVRTEPNPEALALGWVRMGARLRLAAESETSSTCASGWHRVHPHGWVCVGEGVDVGKEPPSSETAVQPPPKDAPLPYDYYFVKEPMVPEYHRLPSRDEQRAAERFADRYQEIAEENGNKDKAERLMKGELSGEPTKPAVVSRYLEREFFVGSAGVEVRAFRHFIRTVTGSYVKKARTEQRTGSDFEGVELGGEHELPVPFALRTVRPLTKEKNDDGSYDFDKDEEAKVYDRQAIVDAWVKKERIGSRIYHRLDMDEGPRFVRSWYIGVAERHDRPEEVGPDEPWVHVDLGEQTLVLYEGDEPQFVTLVSSGLEDHASPTGLFTVHKKMISDTMADLGPEAGDDQYRIEDVPWTQYFEGSVALHGTFWHARFGLQKSHGCINLSPRDAHRIFKATWPDVPHGWHGVATEQTPFKASHVLVTH